MFKKNVKIIFFCFFISFVILLLTSKCSFIYPFNDWGDANSFFTVGKAMFNGIVPYRDIFEQKGILLYFIYGIGYLLSNTSFLGIFLIEIIFWTIGLCFVFKIINLFLDRNYGYIIAPLYMCILCTSRAFVHGGSAEEFCFPIFMMTLYYFLCHFKEENISYKRLIISGLGAGCVFLIKYTLLGFWFAFMLTIFLDLLLKKEYKRGFASCIFFILGMLLPILIGVSYLLFNNAFLDFINVYFKFNMMSYNPNISNVFLRIYEIYKGFLINTCHNSIIIIVLLLLMPISLIKFDLDRRGKISLLVIFILTITGVFWGLKFFKYYLFPILIFILITLIVIFSFASKYFNISNGKWPIFLFLVFIFMSSYFGANYRKMIFKNRKDLFQYKFAEIINRSNEQTLVNMGFLDCGVYTMTGIVPNTYFFERHNIDYEAFPDNLDSFNNYIKNRDTEFIVYYTKEDFKEIVNKEKLLFKNYYLVSDAEKELKNSRFNAYLFRKK